MLKSMTGYARASKVIAGRRVVLEMTSVNKRTLEMHVILPRTFLYYDMLLRESVRHAVSRGQVTIRLHFESDSKKEGGIPVASLKKMKGEWEEVAKKLGYDPKSEVSLDFLMHQMPTMAKEELEEKDLKDLASKALQSLAKMKEKEGSTLVKDIKGRLEQIKKSLTTVESKAPGVVEAFEKRLRDKLAEFKGSDLDEKMAREVVIYADRVDITEEIVRLKSHIEQFDKFLLTKEGSIGRTLEFLAQEMHREMNTMASKVSDSACIHHVVNMKGALDKIREQIQNIE